MMDHALELAVLAASNAAVTGHAGVPLARAGLFQGFGAEELALAQDFLRSVI
jgi:hypothetical protein